MEKKVGRNDPCPCGSGKKYKACCFKSEQASRKSSLTARNLTGRASLIGNAFSKATASSKSLSDRISHVVPKQPETNENQEDPSQEDKNLEQ
ncbi:MAG: hypothetical protein Tsb0021_06490 [Chlamydiales bacterium]